MPYTLTDTKLPVITEEGNEVRITFDDGSSITALKSDRIGEMVPHELVVLRRLMKECRQRFGVKRFGQYLSLTQAQKDDLALVTIKEYRWQ